MIERIKQLLSSLLGKEPTKKETCRYKRWTALEIELFINHSDEYIAEQTSRTVESVRIKRYRLRK